MLGLSRRPAVDTHDTASFRAAGRRTLALRVLFGGGAIVLLAAAVLSARELDPRDRGLLPTGHDRRRRDRPLALDPRRPVRGRPAHAPVARRLGRTRRRRRLLGRPLRAAAARNAVAGAAADHPPADADRIGQGRQPVVGHLPGGHPDLDGAAARAGHARGRPGEGRLDPARQRPRDGARRRARDRPRPALDQARGHARAPARARPVERRACPLRRHPRPGARSRRSPTGRSGSRSRRMRGGGRCRRALLLLGALFLVALAGHERYAGRLALPALPRRKAVA